MVGRRAYGATDAKALSSSLAASLSFLAEAGPTTRGQPPFSWSRSESTHPHRIESLYKTGQHGCPVWRKSKQMSGSVTAVNSINQFLQWRLVTGPSSPLQTLFPWMHSISRQSWSGGSRMRRGHTAASVSWVGGVLWCHVFLSHVLQSYSFSQHHNYFVSSLRIVQKNYRA